MPSNALSFTLNTTTERKKKKPYWNRLKQPGQLTPVETGADPDLTGTRKFIESETS